jgi:adenylate cyclase
VLREQRIRDRLARYCPAAVDTIAGTGLPDEMLAEEREVSILFLDISGFTALAESLDPGAVTRLLNDVFGRLSETIFAFEGTLDKFMGDGIMAIFGAPLVQHDHALRAVRAALRMQAQMEALPPVPGADRALEVRIGINSGPVIAGDIGSPRRKDYTVIGDAVNVASRLESEVARPGEIIIGPATAASVGDRFALERLEPRTLKGKSGTITPHRVRAEQDPAPRG